MIVIIPVYIEFYFVVSICCHNYFILLYCKVKFELCFYNNKGEKYSTSSISEHYICEYSNNIDHSPAK